MTTLRLPLVLLFALGFLCISNANPITSLFGKSSDDKTEADDKTVTAVKPAETTTTTTTTTPEPSSSCGGLKGFLHICDKNEPTEPPKSVKTRSVSEEDDSDSDEEDSESVEDDNDSDEKKNEEEEKQISTETSPIVSESTEGGMSKRQVGDPEAPIIGEIPPVVGDAMEIPQKPNEEKDEDVKKRQTDESEDEENSEESTEGSRRRRDCRDREGDYDKDCRKKREFVPSCFGLDCKRNQTTEADE